MIRRLSAACLLLASVGLMVSLWMVPARAQFASPVVPSFRIVGQHNQIANVTHLGELVVNAQVNATVDNIRHISSVTHVAIVGGLSVSTSVDNISHITSMTHVAAHVVRSFGKHATDVVDVTTSAFRVNVVSGGLSSGGSVSQSGPWVVTAVHQGTSSYWNVNHISSVTHVAVASGSITVTGGPVSVTQSGAWTNLTVAHIGSVVHVAIAGASGGSLPVNQSGGWVVQAAHQAGEWNVRHIGSETHVAVVRGTLDRLNHVATTVHIAGIIRGFGTAGTNVVDTSTASLQVNCVAGCSTNTSIAHITSVVHVQGSGGGLRVQQASQFGGNRWVIDHIASAVHVVAAGGTINAAQSGSWTIAHITSVVHVAGQLEAVGQWNTSHITSITHIAGIVRGFGARGIDVVDLTNNALQMNCVAGCSSNTSIAHVSSLTHISGSVGAIPVTIWIRDGATTRLAHVDSSGNLQVALAVANISHLTSVTHIAGNVEVNNVRHISSTVHISGIIRGFGTQGISVVDATNQSLQVTAVAGSLGAAQSGVWNVVAHLGGISNIQHIGGALHIAGTINGARIHIQGIGQPGAAHGGVMTIQGVTGMIPLEVNCTGCSAAAVTNVGHISSVTHISGSYGAIPIAIQIRDSATTRFAHVDSSGALVTTATLGSIGHITSVMHVVVIPNSNANAIIAVHASTLGHITSVTHIAGIIRGFGTAGTNVVDTANSSLQVSCVTGCAGGTPLSHISSITHVVIVDWQRWAHVASAQSGTWNVNAHQAGAWSVFAFQSGALTVQAAHQGGEWNVRHIGSVTHIQGSVFLADKSDPARTAQITHGNALAVHIASIGPNNGEPTFCHSTASFVIHAGTQVAPVIHVTAGSRVAICSVVIVASVANDVSLVEGNDANGDQNNQGVWSGGCGARSGPATTVWTPLMGGASRGLALAANGGWSTATAIPWLKTATRGNSVCLVKQTGGGHVTGTITYAGYR